MKIAVVISIPVHENTDVVINQIQNFHKYIPHAVIVLHVSKQFTEKDELVNRVSQFQYVYLNPSSVECSWDNLIWAHIANFKYISGIIDFDYFMMHASNDMYFRSGVEEYICRFTAGFHVHKVFKHSRWWPGNRALKDEYLKIIMSKADANEIIATQVESSFYKKDLFDQIVGIIESVPGIRENAQILRYTREEVYFSTVAYALVNHKEIGYPTTFSEVHRFDGRLWKLQILTLGMYRRLGICKIISREKYDAFEQYYSGGIGKHRFWRLTVNDVKRLLRNDSLFIKRNLFLDDEASKYQLYGYEFFSAKRVDRNIQDPVRVYINSL